MDRAAGMPPPVSPLLSSPSPPLHLHRRPRPLAPRSPRWPLRRLWRDGGGDGCQPSRLRHVRPPRAVPIIAPGDQWGNWAFLLSAAAFGTWAEERTAWGAALSGALVSILAGLAASSAGLVAPGAPAQAVVMEYLLPVAVPLLLLGADLRRVVRATGDLLKAFLIGSVATVIGTTVAYLLFPMRSLGQDSWKIAAALMGSYIGGAVNFVAISEALGTTPSVVAAGVAADNLISALYFTALFALASKIPPEPNSASSPEDGGEGEPRGSMSVLHGGAALALSFTICRAGTGIAAGLGVGTGGTLPCVTALVVALATAFPGVLGRLAPSGETMALILMQVFFTVVGANGSVVDAVTKAPAVFAFAAVQVAVHLAVVLGVGRLAGLDRKQLLIASNANVGGPTTAAAMATAKGWSSLVVPGILVGIFGISIATFFGIGFGMFVLRRISGF
uniref:Predicted protein n=1 Tax=Hordeum vulgare subsp. vulgare TaxID=112509 RepID=F2D222_HORVV|nr:predicted protein [Hordeum vulgare subsp. vulgare]